MKRMCGQCGKRPIHFRVYHRNGRTYLARDKDHDLCRQCWELALAALKHRDAQNP